MRVRVVEELIVSLGASVLAGAGYGVTRVYRWLRPERSQRTPVVGIGAAAPGAFVRIIGRVVAGEPLVAPVTGRACVAYDAAISWGTERVVGRRDVRGAPFLVEDDTGRAQIDPRGAFVLLHYQHTVEPGDPARLVTHDPGFRAGLPPRWDWVVTEGTLAIGDTVAVIGRVEADSGEDPVYRQASGPGRRIVGAADRPLVISTRGGDLLGQ